MDPDPAGNLPVSKEDEDFDAALAAELRTTFVE